MRRSGRRRSSTSSPAPCRPASACRRRAGSSSTTQVGRRRRGHCCRAARRRPRCRTRTSWNSPPATTTRRRSSRCRASSSTPPTGCGWSTPARRCSRRPNTAAPSWSASTSTPTRSSRPSCSRPSVALPTTYLNDVRFDLRRGEPGIAFITDSSNQGPNGIIVVDLASGQSWRRLHDHPSTKAVPARHPAGRRGRGSSWTGPPTRTRRSSKLGSGRDRDLRRRQPALSTAR